MTALLIILSIGFGIVIGGAITAAIVLKAIEYAVGRGLNL